MASKSSIEALADESKVVRTVYDYVEYSLSAFEIRSAAERAHLVHVVTRVNVGVSVGLSQGIDALFAMRGE